MDRQREPGAIQCWACVDAVEPTAVDPTCQGRDCAGDDDIEPRLLPVTQPYPKNVMQPAIGLHAGCQIARFTKRVLLWPLIDWPDDHLVFVLPNPDEREKRHMLAGRRVNSPERPVQEQSCF